MVSQRKILVQNLKPGMVVASGVLSSTGNLLISEHTTLNSKMILLLKFNNIDAVTIEERGAESEDNAEDSSTAVKNTPEFKEFKKKYDNSLDAYTNTLNDIIYRNDAINTQKLLKEVNDIVNKDIRNNIQLFSMLHNLESSDDVTYVHSMNVALISNIIGRWLKLSDGDLELLTLSGLLHDIGKSQISEEIIKKPGALTPKEMTEMRKHAIIGYNMVKDQNIDQRIKNVILSHHERCDGSGYPLKITGKEISFPSRIIAICDVFDAMTSERCYRKAFNPFDVIHLFETEGYHKFDTEVLLVFLNNILETYIHSLVELSNGQIGEIIFLNRTNPSRPVIKIGARCIDLLMEQSLSISRMV